MANRHVKTINGRKYYYESIRKGKKVTSRYLGPVEPKDVKPDDVVNELFENVQTPAQPKLQEQKKKPLEEEEEFYIG